MTIVEFRGILRALNASDVAALLRELGHELYQRELRSWRVLIDMSDELIDQETMAARQHTAQRLIAEERAYRRKRRRAA